MGQAFSITPARRLSGEIAVSGDKSISHRALMLAALAEGESVIEGLLPGDDPRSTAACLRALGAEISGIDGPSVRVRGVGLGRLHEPADVLDMGNSGTTMRLMLGVLAGQPGLFCTLTGDRSLRSRPMLRVVSPLRQMGARIWGREEGGRAPLAVWGEQLRAIDFVSPVASAQVKSAVLLAGLLAEGLTSVSEPVRSRDHSERMLRAFGAEVLVDGTTAAVRGPARLRAQSLRVPGDISSAAFWLVAGSIVPDSQLLLSGVGVNPTRTGILDALTAMGADIAVENRREVCGEPVADLRVRSASLKACTIGGEWIPRLVDEIPVLAVAACCAAGKTVIRDAAELRVKESDRLATMARELGRLGAHIEERPDGLVIEGGHPLVGAGVESHADHRVAMSLAVAGLVAAGTTKIADSDCATVSYPQFYEQLARVRQP
ncbi:MAG: 3-phosphoshikimate 1-carboxyvinyltransferase [Aphanocapsa lilacina HA4352-LM1]|nr:3-phosphoshikimate 1-carboxyvinyltransferase [Aphanocapsa lilacina HA4352-LM1]